MTSTIENKITILGEVYAEYRDNKRWDKYFLEEMVGVSLAWLIWTDQLSKDVLTDTTISYIDFAWHQLLNGWGVEDTGFETLGQVIERIK